jgi:KDO2-lipid IV(A) lauroyltransferase
VLEAALSRGRGVVVVSGHVGNWELLALRVARSGIARASAVAKETSDSRMTALLEEFRAANGLHSIWRGQDGAAKQILRSLRDGEILGLLIDQDTRVQSVFVPFFGRSAATPRAAADLALRTGAGVVCAFCQRTRDGRYRISMQELGFQPGGDREADVRELTAAMTRQIEEAIRRSPEQWVWMHRRWKTQP